MYEDLSYTFKDILKRIFNCINDYIDKNINNPSLVESKLLLINNYIIDILFTPEISQNSFIHTTNQNNSQQNIMPDKYSSNQLKSSREYEEKKNSIIKFKRKYFNNIKEKNECFIHSYNDTNIDSNNKMKTSTNTFKIIKLKRKLKNEHENNKLKEISNIQRLLNIQKDLIFIENKKNKNKEKNNINNLGFITINNSFKNRNNNNIYAYLNKMKTKKHSMSQCKIDNRMNNEEKNNYNDMKLKYELLLKKQKTLKKNNFIKFDFGEIKKSINKQIDKIKGINLSSPSSFRIIKIKSY